MHMKDFSTCFSIACRWCLQCPFAHAAYSTVVSCSWHPLQSEWRRFWARDPQHSGHSVPGVLHQYRDGLLRLGRTAWGGPAATCVGDAHCRVLLPHMGSRLYCSCSGDCGALEPPQNTAPMGTARQDNVQLAQVSACYTGCAQIASSVQFAENDRMSAPDICMLYRVSTVSAVYRKWLNDCLRFMHAIQGVHRLLAVCSLQKMTMTAPDICMLYRVSTVSAVYRKWLNDCLRFMHAIQGVHTVLLACSLQKVSDFRRYMYVTQCVHTLLAVWDIQG